MSGHDTEGDLQGLTAFETLIEQAGKPSIDDSVLADWQALDLGRYRLLRELGRGGMGVVFLAEQLEPVERQVALKLIRRRVRNSDSLTRFEIERQALARMQHPYIAQVYDAGTTADGHPYFVMEYVAGVPLDRYCHDERLDIAQRLLLFIRVCRGVQHAHQKGIIHRDLKPANVLVSRVDGVAMPRIIDFGIATSIGIEAQPRQDACVGTPHYMSPEQFRRAEAGLDTRSDVYSLGVILYELLVDHLPIPRSSFSATASAAALALAFDQPRRKPSELLDTVGPGEQIADQRRTTIKGLRRRLKDDLDAIVMKALALEPEDRYASAGDLAEDIERMLRHEPVSAVASRPMYRARKFIRRHAMALGSASAILLALLGGLAAATLAMFEAQRQFQIAEQRQHELEQVTRFQQAMLEGIDPRNMGEGILEEIRRQWQGGLEREGLDPALADEVLSEAMRHVNTTDLARQTLSRHVLERATESVAREFAGQDGLQAELYSSIHAVYRAIDLPARLRELAEKVLYYRRASLGPDALPVLQAEFDLAWAHYLNNDLAQAEAELSAALSRLDEADPEQREMLLRARNDLGTILVDQGRLEDAIALSSETVRLAGSWLSPDDVLSSHIYSSAGFVQARARNLEQALVYFEQALAGMRKSLPPDDPRIGRAMLNVASALGQSGRQAEALQIDQELVAFLTANEGRRSTNTLRAMSNMANNLSAVGRMEESIELLHETRDLATEALGAGHPLTLRVRLNLGSVLARSGDHARAQTILAAVVEERLALLGPDHQETLSAQEVLATVLLDSDRSDEALGLLETVLDRRLGLFGPQHPQTMIARRLLGRALLDSGQYAAAQEQTGQALQHFVTQLRPDDTLLMTTALDLLRIEIALGELDAARLTVRNHLEALQDPDTVQDQHAELARQLAELRPKLGSDQPGLGNQ